MSRIRSPAPLWASFVTGTSPYTTNAISPKPQLFPKTSMVRDWKRTFEMHRHYSIVIHKDQMSSKSNQYGDSTDGSCFCACILLYWVENGSERSIHMSRCGKEPHAWFFGASIRTAE